MFRLINVNDRAALEHDGHYYDLATLSGQSAFSDPMVAISHFNELHALQKRCRSVEPNGLVSAVTLSAPVSRPRQVFGIGLNYHDHATETAATLPPVPLTFTKFPSCISGPTSDVLLSGEFVDWEVELVVVIGTEVSHVAREDAWSTVAGLTLGQDISDRVVQRTGTPPQFSLGKSFST